MAIRIRFPYPTGSKLAYSVERLADGLLLDFADSTFKADPAQPTRPIPEDVGIFRGRYKDTLDPTPAAQFPDGHYAVTVHDEAAGLVAAELAANVFGGDDTPSAQVTDGKVDALRADVEKAADAIVAEVRKPRPLFAGVFPAN